MKVIVSTQFAMLVDALDAQELSVPAQESIYDTFEDNGVSDRLNGRCADYREPQDKAFEDY